MLEAITAPFKGRPAAEIDKPLIIKPTFYEMLYPDSASDVMRNILAPVYEKYKIKVDPCDRTAKYLEKLKEEGGTSIFNPGLPLKDLLRSWSKYDVEKNLGMKFQLDHIKEKQPSKKGWVDIEFSIDAPNRNLTTEELERLFISKGVEGLKATNYFIGSMLMQEITGHCFDENGTISMLLGDQYKDGSPVRAFTHPNGTPFFFWHSSDLAKNPRVGGRWQRTNPIELSKAA